MTGNDLASMYEFSYFAINRNLKELTHEDSVLVPEPSGNCINWVLGHIISARGMMLLLRSAEHLCSVRKTQRLFSAGRRQ